MMERLRILRVDAADRRVLTNLYWGQKAVVKIGDDRSEWTEIQRGVRQGCVLSPDLFSLYSQAAMDEMESMEGINIGKKISITSDTPMIRY